MPARAASSKQWRYLNWKFGHAWTKRHQISPPNRKGLPVLGTERNRTAAKRALARRKR